MDQEDSKIKDMEWSYIIEEEVINNPKLQAVGEDKLLEVFELQANFFLELYRP